MSFLYSAKSLNDSLIYIVEWVKWSKTHPTNKEYEIKPVFSTTIKIRIVGLRFANPTYLAQNLESGQITK